MALCILCLCYTFNAISTSMMMALPQHHQVNAIKGGPSPLFTIRNADFKLTTSVLFCLPQVNECAVILNNLIDNSNYIQRYL